MHCQTCQALTLRIKIDSIPLLARRMSTPGIIEAWSAAEFQPNRTFDNFQLTNDLVGVSRLCTSLFVDRHEVNQFHNRISREKSGEQNVRVGEIKLLEPDLFELRFDLEASAALGV